VFAQEDFVTDIQGAGHGARRVIRPAVAGSVPVKATKLDQDIPGRPGGAPERLPRRVAPRVGAIKAMQQLKVEWSKVEPPFPNQNALYDTFAGAGAQARRSRQTAGDVDEGSRPRRR